VVKVELLLEGLYKRLGWGIFFYIFIFKPLSGDISSRSYVGARDGISEEVLTNPDFPVIRTRRDASKSYDQNLCRYLIYAARNHSRRNREPGGVRPPLLISILLKKYDPYNKYCLRIICCLPISM
jgi:hypothetical protein